MSVNPANSSIHPEAANSALIDNTQQSSSGRSTLVRDNDEQLVAQALLAHPSIDDCAVLLRETEGSQQEVAAYVVLKGQFSPEGLHSHLQRTLPEIILPKINFVPVSGLPLTAEGELDEEALTRLAVIDSELVRRWEETLQSQPEIEKVAVIVQEQAEKVSPLHLSDLLPDWEATHPIATGAKIAPAAPSTTPSAETDTKPLAISQGVALELEAEAPTNLGQALKRATLCSPDKGITYIQADGSDTTQLYPALLEEAERILAGLRELGLKPQDKVIFQFDSNQDYIPAFWGCILGGFVPVPISAAPTYDSANSVVKKLINAWQRLEQPPILTNKTIAPQLRTLSEQLNLENFRIETLEDLRSRDRDPNWHDSQPDDLALLLLTSGSTGVPKGVMLSHRNILSSVAATSQMGGLTSQDISLNWLPLDHPGPLIRCVIRIVFLGAQQIHASTAIVLSEPLKWLDWLDRYRVTSAWAPNFAFALINDRAEEVEKGHWDLSSVKSILNTAEPIVTQTAQRFQELLKPHGLAANVMHSSWGMAETSSGVTYSDRYISDSSTSQEQTFAELGSPIPGISLRIINRQNEVVEEQTIGYLQVKGSTVTSGYYQNSELNQEVFSDEGWFNTGDLGFLSQGRLYITGRTKDVIIINGNNIYSHEVEGVVEAIEGIEVSYTAACGTRKPGSNTDDLIVFFHTQITEKAELVKLLKEIRQNVARKIGATPAYLLPVEKETIPKTSIGKIQRSQLKKRFEDGEFADIVKQIDILLENENTLPNWFYHQTWRRQEAVTLAPQSGMERGMGQSLIFLDFLGLGKLLCTELDQCNQSWVGVEIGSEFTKLADNRYCLDPSNPDHYRQLLESVASTNLPIDQVVHLWSYDKYTGEVLSPEALEAAQVKGSYSLLLLVQALAEVQGSETAVRLQVIASHSQPTSQVDKLACERTPMLGLVKTIPQEMPWLDCRHLDLVAEDVTNDAAYAIRELQVIQQEQEVAYRDGQRLVTRLERVDLSQQGKQELPFQPGGMYLISGGLGGIGTEIAKYLLEHYKVRLLLVGRTPLPERDTWQAHLQQSDRISERIQAYLSLEQLDGEVVYEAVDICELAQLQQVVERRCRDWQCELDGVIHLAGTTPRRQLLEETPSSLSATLRPKVLGTWVLHQLLKDRPHSLFIGFSSVNGFFGGYGAGAYGAANRFLDYFAHHQRTESSVNSYCFAWSMWDEVGMSRNFEMKDLTRAKGYNIITAEQGLNSLLAGLQRNRARLLVGLDDSKKDILRYTQTDAYNLQKLTAYFTASSDDLSVAQLQELTLCDRFGTPSSCVLRQIPEMPLTETGEIDKEKIAATGSGAKTERVAPTTEVERQLVSIWQGVLGVPQIGIHDNFFELGGTSILAARLFPQIEKEFGKNLPLAILFEAPTVEQLAKILDQEEDSVTWSCLVAIQPNGSRRPFFCVHGGFGEVLGYQTLAQKLGSDRPFYALRPVGLDGVQKPLTTIEEMAARYVSELLAFQPEGPYLLGGWCSGGTVAFEMAQQLKAQGHEIARLVMIDTVYPQLVNYFLPRYRYYRQDNKPRFRFKEKDYLFYVFVVLYHLRELKLKRGQHLYPMIEEISLFAKQTFSKFAGNGKVSQEQEPDFSDSFERQAFVKDQFFEVFLQALQTYVPKSYSGKIDFLLPTLNSYVPIAYPGQLNSFLPNQKAVKDSSPLLFGWDKVALGGFEIHEFEVRHDYMMEGKYVQKLVDKLKNCINSVV